MSVERPTEQSDFYQPISRRSLLKSAAVAVAALILDRIPSAEAADRQHIYIVGKEVYFFNIGGRTHIFDKSIDPYLNLPVQGGTMEIWTPDHQTLIGKSIFANKTPQIPNVKINPENIGWAVVSIDAQADTTMTMKDGKQVPAKKIAYRNTQDPENWIDLTVPIGELQILWFGRELKAQKFLNLLNSYPEVGKDLTPGILAQIKDQAQKEQATPEPTPTALVPPSTSIVINNENNNSIIGGPNSKENPYWWAWPAALGVGLLGIGAGLAVRGGSRMKVYGTSQPAIPAGPTPVRVEQPDVAEERKAQARRDVVNYQNRADVSRREAERRRAEAHRAEETAAHTRVPGRGWWERRHARNAAEQANRASEQADCFQNLAENARQEATR